MTDAAGCPDLSANQVADETPGSRKACRPPRDVGQIVLVLQGGGALGAYQAGVYQALHEAGIEPDWVIGTSIGAINASLIAGNEPADRPERLKEFWGRIEQKPPATIPRSRSRRRFASSSTSRACLAARRA